MANKMKQKTHVSIQNTCDSKKYSWSETDPLKTRACSGALEQFSLGLTVVSAAPTPLVVTALLRRGNSRESHLVVVTSGKKTTVGGYPLSFGKQIFRNVNHFMITTEKGRGTLTHISSPRICLNMKSEYYLLFCIFCI